MCFRAADLVTTAQRPGAGYATVPLPVIACVARRGTGRPIMVFQNGRSGQSSGGCTARGATMVEGRPAYPGGRIAASTVQVAPLRVQAMVPASPVICHCI